MPKTSPPARVKSKTGAGAEMAEKTERPGPRARGVGKRTKDRTEAVGAETMKMYSLRMPEELVRELKRLAKERAWGYQALARLALTEFVAKRAT